MFFINAKNQYLSLYKGMMNNHKCAEAIRVLAIRLTEYSRVDSLSVLLRHQIQIRNVTRGGWRERARDRRRVICRLKTSMGRVTTVFDLSGETRNVILKNWILCTFRNTNFSIIECAVISSIRAQFDDPFS